MLFLEDVTLVIVDTFKHERALKVIRRSLDQINVQKVKFFTDKQINSEYEIINIPTIIDKIQYSKFMMKALNDYIDTEFILTIQWDGYVLNGSAWNDVFLNYDYIGSPWPWINNIVGNGGFSLRSKKLLKLCSETNFKVTHPEDYVICQLYRKQIENRGIKFAPFKIANRFSIEVLPYNGQFGYHNWRGIQIKKKQKIIWSDCIKNNNEQYLNKFRG